MPRIRSLVTPIRVEWVKKAHDCSGNSRHRLVKGDRRLAVKEGRSWDTYCIECGRRILTDDAGRIARALELISSGQVSEAENA